MRPQPTVSKPIAAAQAQPIFGGFKQTQQAASTSITQPQQVFNFGGKPVSPNAAVMQQSWQQQQQQQQQQLQQQQHQRTFSFGPQSQSAATSSGGFRFAPPSQTSAVFRSKAATATTSQSMIQKFSFKPSASAASAGTFGQRKPYATSTTSSQSPFANFSFSGSPASSSATATTTASSAQKPAASSMFGQPAKLHVFGQASKPTAAASGDSFAKPVPVAVKSTPAGM